MRLISGIAYAIAMGVVGAGIVHIAILMMIPSISDNDTWTRIGSLGPDYEFHLVDIPDGEESNIVKTNDPLFAIAACRFNVAEGPVHITGDQGVPFWSLSVFDRKGQNIYSLNDRNATDKVLDLVVATPLQTIELKKDLPPELEPSIFIEADISEGMVVLRAFVPDASWNEIVATFLAGAVCEGA